MTHFTPQYASNCLAICYTLQDDLTHFRNRQQRFMSTTTNYRDEETKGGMKATLEYYNINNDITAY